MAEYFDIFISYRRNGGQQAAECIHKWLAKEEGYSVFYDKESLREGRWNQELYKQVRICKDFILIVDRHIFDRISHRLHK